MEDLLRRQTEHLAHIVGLLKTDRIIQAVQTVETRQIVADEDKLVKKLDGIHETIKSIDSKVSTGNDQQLSREDEAAREAESANSKHLAALRKIQETLSKNNEFRDIADKAKGEPIFKSIGDKFRDLKESINGIKKSVTGVSLKSMGQGIASSVSSRYKDRLEYMQNERNLGSRKHEKTMKKDYAERSRMLQRNVKNEEQLLKLRGSLSEEDYLKGDTKGAREYLKEKAAIGKGLKKTDTRYSIDERVAAREEKAAARLANKFRSTANNVGSVVSTQANAIAPMVNSNLASRETAIESDRATKDYQETQLHNAEESYKVLTDQLDVQKEILEIMKKAPTTSTGAGIAGAIPAVAGGIGAAGIGAGIAGAASRAGTIIKQTGSTAIKAMGNVARAAAAPLAVGVIGAAAANYAANEYSDSFGEGGFDLVKKLHDDKVIDYNATIMGYNPSEILDWKAIEALPPKDLKTLMDSGVEFSKEDTSRLHELYTKELITGGKEGTKSKAVTPERDVKPSSDLNIQKSNEFKATPSSVTPTAADTVYNKSAETSNLNKPASANVNNVIAPTTNVSSSTAKTIMKTDVRNNESSINRLFSNRLSFQ